jgi:hypothetical protein
VRFPLSALQELVFAQSTPPVPKGEAKSAGGRSGAGGVNFQENIRIQGGSGVFINW